jgi:hypothetical protein
MKCLHGQPANHTVTQKGSFGFCKQIPSCDFICSEDEGFLYEKAIKAWRALKSAQDTGHGEPAKMRVVKDLIKLSYGRPFFVCSRKSEPCSFWMWGDVHPSAFEDSPNCNHGISSAIRRVTKKSLNKGRKFKT